MTWSAEGWTCGMTGLRLRRWYWMRFYALTISVVREALPITASRDLRAETVEVCRKLEGLMVGCSKVLVAWKVEVGK